MTEASEIASKLVRYPTWLRRIGAVSVSLTLGVLPLACGPADTDSLLGPYLPRNAHQAYGYSLAQARLLQTALGSDWLSSAERALTEPEQVELPFAADEPFDASSATALGYAFSVPFGRRIEIVVRLQSDQSADVFVDLYEQRLGELVRVASAAPASEDGDGVVEHRIGREVLENTNYVLRAQPELLRSGSLQVRVDVLPMLAFPVTGLSTRAIQSVFGAERDGGRRAHRGVDIFADRGTDAVAALDAWVSRVDTTPRGGNVVWLQPLFGSVRLYYAHLDTQLVEEGQFVRAGDIVGTVGNTGNAITTPPHLHFGVYLRRRGMRGGARDPYDFLH